MSVPTVDIAGKEEEKGSEWGKRGVSAQVRRVATSSEQNANSISIARGNFEEFYIWHPRTE